MTSKTIEMKTKKSDITIYPPYFSEYYLPLLPDEPIHDMLRWRTENFMSFWGAIPLDKWDYSYSPGKWTIKQILQHLIDSEQIFCYRALCFLRGDKRPIEGYDQDLYTSNAKIEDLTVEDMLNSLTLQVMYTYNFYKHLKHQDLTITGHANGYPIQVGALVLATIGHDLHHRMNIETRYL